MDDPDLHADRIKLWNEFNTCWLAILQKQKELTLLMLESGSHPPPPQSLISAAYLDKMAKDLIRLCDDLEKHGLVDYQYGVWEEQIIQSTSAFPRGNSFSLTLQVLAECVDLLEPPAININATATAGTGDTGPSLHATRGTGGAPL